MVQQQSINTGDKPDIVIDEVSGDLRLMGWERGEVLAKVEGELSLTQEGEVVRLHCGGDAVVRVPVGAALRIERASGDMRIKAVKGLVQIGNAAGDLALREVGAVSISSSLNDTSIKHVAGALQIDNIGNDLSILDVQGACTVGNVGNDLSARGIRGNTTVGNVSGDAVLEGIQGVVSIENISGDLRAAGVEGNFSAGNVSGDANISGVPGQVTVRQVSSDLNVQGVSSVNANVSGDATITFARVLGQSAVTASGDINCRFPPDAGATVKITSAAANINVSAPGLSRTIEENAYEMKLGGGENPVALNASGDVSVAANGASRDEPAFDFHFNFGPEMRGFDEAGWEGFGDRIAQRAREAAERATAGIGAKVQARVERAARKAEEHARRAESRVHGAEKRVQWTGRRMNVDGGWRPDRPPAPPEPPRDPVSNEERMTILRMLAQKKITAEQADQLLAALSGK